MVKTVKMKVIGMECPNCTMILEQMEDKLTGVLRVEASYRKAEMEVQYDDNVVTLDQIRSEIHQLGYQASIQR
jgi:copper chaperone CopZ